jgi:putative flippase GtrA
VQASALGYLVSAAVSYLLNRRYTYASGAPHAAAAWKFGVVMVTGLAINSLFMQLLQGYLHWHYMPAQLVATAGSLAWNFCAHRYWTFSRSH